jgi:hypothetical protein
MNAAFFASVPVLLLVAGARAQTLSECLTCVTNAGITGGQFCVANPSSCSGNASSCGVFTACNTTACCMSRLQPAEYCSLYHNVGQCLKQANCALDWVRSTEATGCGHLSFEYRCCVKRPTACTFRGNTGVCTKSTHCTLAWVSQATGAVGCENEPGDIKCCAQNTPSPTPRPPSVPVPPNVVPTTTTTTAIIGPPTTTAPTTTALQIFTTNAKMADCSSVFRCSTGVCILDNTCACQLPLIQHPKLGCTVDESISTQCRSRPCNTDPVAPFCAVLGDDAFCFASNGTFVPRPRVVQTTDTAAPPLSDSDTGAMPPRDSGGLDLGAIIGIVVTVVVLALIAGVIICVCLVRQRRQNQLSAQQKHFHGSSGAKSSPRQKNRGDDGNAIVMTTAAQNYDDHSSASSAKSSNKSTTDYASMPGTTTTTIKAPYMSDAAYVGDAKREQPLF